MRQATILLGRILTLSVVSLCAIASFASAADSLNAVTFVSYVQQMLDTHGTIALKNNTQEQIHNVSFRITYKDMSDRQLDYRDYFEEVEIEPGLTKQIDIPGYETDRQFSYAGSSESYAEANKKFKIQFKLLGYNKKVDKLVNADQDMDYDPTAEKYVHSIGKYTLLTLLFLLLFSVGLFVLVAVVARRERRDALPWVLISLFITPIVSLIVLAIIGKSKRIPPDGSDGFYDSRHDINDNI